MNHPEPKVESTIATIIAEVRADRGEAAEHAAWPRLFALRTRAAGGASELHRPTRTAALIGAAERYELIELEEQDLIPSLLGRIAPERRVLMLRVAATESEASVRERLDRVCAVPAGFHHIVCAAHSHEDTLRPLRILRAMNRADVVAYSEGTIGTWTRAVAPQIGAPAVIGTLSGDISADGVPGVQRLVEDYGFPSVRPARELFGIAGDPIFGSLSPRLHNAAFRELGRAALYVPFHVRSFEDFWGGLVAGAPTDEFGLPLRALCVVSPHKTIALGAARSATAIVERARSSNFFVRESGGWIADTTDAAGLLIALDDHRIDVTARKAAVVGCGGSGRVIAAALHQAGADVTLVNRGRERATLAVRLLHLPFQRLQEFSPSGYSIVVNATPLGGGGEPPPFAIDDLDDDAVVVDLVYGQRPTPLVGATRGNGRVVIDGRDILVRQAMRQFLLMTGQKMPAAVVHRVLGPVTLPITSPESERQSQRWTAS